MRLFLASVIFVCAVGFIGCKVSSKCPSGQFMAKNQCVLCHPTCSECSGHELFECTTCGVDENGQERFLNQGRCRTHCPRGLYPERARYACLPCISNCELCTDGSICAKCREHYKLQNGVCQPLSCDMGQVQDPDTGECINCEMGCKTCSTGYFLDPEGSCVLRCPSGSFANSATQLCEECSPNCEACVDNSDNCISCSKSGSKLFLHQGRCWSNCPDGSYEGTDGTCEACDSSCRTCDGIKTQCLSCADGYYLESGTCSLNCTLRTYPADDGTCRRCPPHCDICSDDRTCFKCSFLYLMLHGACKASCPRGYYEDMEEGRCGQCHPTCGTCSGPMADDCESCSSLNPKLYKGACTKDCPSRTYYENEAMECQDGWLYRHDLTAAVVSGLCVEAPKPSGTDLKMSPRAARARKRLCWSQSYERLSGSGSSHMPHGVPEPDSGDEVDVVYTSRGGSAFRRYSFIHENEGDEEQEMTENMRLN
ncbi:unnamed protein product [Tetraodon nigroviridis]|uniref:(spotted green pufferfish) hypothetical protein n=1 Tax=Tetraodon nigroviridis TaxID=99883 RepID=Q4SM16_TETNG|nr:unnamed protein product [Tetraodon nigroviridis]